MPQSWRFLTRGKKRQYQVKQFSTRCYALGEPIDQWFSAIVAFSSPFTYIFIPGQPVNIHNVSLKAIGQTLLRVRATYRDNPVRDVLDFWLVMIFGPIREKLVEFARLHVGITNQCAKYVKGKLGAWFYFDLLLYCTQQRTARRGPQMIRPTRRLVDQCLEILVLSIPPIAVSYWNPQLRTRFESLKLWPNYSIATPMGIQRSLNATQP